MHQLLIPPLLMPQLLMLQLTLLLLLIMVTVILRLPQSVLKVATFLTALLTLNIQPMTLLTRSPRMLCF